MTPDEWLACTDPDRLLWAAGYSSRKLVLLACACARRVWHLLPDEPGRRLIERLERKADEDAPHRNIVRDVSALAAAILSTPAGKDRRARHSSPKAFGLKGAVQQVLIEARVVKAAAPRQLSVRPKAVRVKERRHQRLLLQDFMRGPFGPGPGVHPDCLTWNGGIVRNLAQAIYEEGDFRRLPILGDALEEAGCDDGPLLEHCRRPGPHARGCWALDVLLARE